MTMGRVSVIFHLLAVTSASRRKEGRQTLSPGRWRRRLSPPGSWHIVLPKWNLITTVSALARTCEVRFPPISAHFSGGPNVLVMTLMNWIRILRGRWGEFFWGMFFTSVENGLKSRCKSVKWAQHFFPFLWHLWEVLRVFTLKEFEEGFFRMEDSFTWSSCWITCSTTTPTSSFMLISWKSINIPEAMSAIRLAESNFSHLK